MVLVIGGKLYRNDLKGSSYLEVRVVENKLQFLCERNPGEIDFGMSYQESTLYEKPCFHRFIIQSDLNKPNSQQCVRSVFRYSF